MKNFILNEINNTNLLSVDTNSIEDSKDAYRVLRWKKLIPESFKVMRNQWDSLIKECFTEDELKAVNTDAEKSKELQEKINKFNGLFNELMADDTACDIKPISFETWHKMLKESDIKLGRVEPELEGILFTAPED